MRSNSVKASTTVKRKAQNTGQSTTKVQKTDNCPVIHTASNEKDMSTKKDVPTKKDTLKEKDVPTKKDVPKEKDVSTKKDTPSHQGMVESQITVATVKKSSFDTINPSDAERLLEIRKIIAESKKPDSIALGNTKMTRSRTISENKPKQQLVSISSAVPVIDVKKVSPVDVKKVPTVDVKKVQVTDVKKVPKISLSSTPVVSGPVVPVPIVVVPVGAPVIPVPIEVELIAAERRVIELRRQILEEKKFRELNGLEFIKNNMPFQSCFDLLSLVQIQKGAQVHCKFNTESSTTPVFIKNHRLTFKYECKFPCFLYVEIRVIRGADELIPFTHESYKNATRETAIDIDFTKFPSDVPLKDEMDIYIKENTGLGKKQSRLFAVTVSVRNTEKKLIGIYISQSFRVISRQLGPRDPKVSNKEENVSSSEDEPTLINVESKPIDVESTEVELKTPVEPTSVESKTPEEIEESDKIEEEKESTPIEEETSEY